MGKYKLKKEQIEKIPEMKDLGFSDQEIGDKFGVSRATIYRYRSPAAYARHKERAKEYSAEHATAMWHARKTTRMEIRLSFHRENDKKVIAKLESVDNIQDYVRSLILKDIEAQKEGEADG